MTLSSLLVNLKHPCEIKVFIFIISFPKKINSKFLNGSLVYNVTKAFSFQRMLIFGSFNSPSTPEKIYSTDLDIHDNNIFFY